MFISPYLELGTGVVRKGALRKSEAHEAIVSDSDWLAAQDVFVRGASKQNGNSFALRSLVRCAGCSYTMRGGGYKPKGKARTPQYQCVPVHGSGTCPAPACINESVLLPWVTEQFVAKVTDDYEARPQVATPTLDKATAELAEAQLKLSAYLSDSEVESIVGRDSYLLGARSRAEAVTEANTAVLAAKGRATGVELPPIDDLRAVWPTLTKEERRQLFGAAIVGVFVKRGRGKVEDRAEILWVSDPPIELSSIGKSLPLAQFDW